MESIKIQKLTNRNIRENGKQIRVALDVDQKLNELSEETGMTKTLITDLLLRKALKYVVIEESEI